MSNAPTFANYDQGLISRRPKQVSESCGLSRDEVRLLLSVQRGSNGKAELQFIELIELLTVLVGSSPVAQSDWLRTTNLDLGHADNNAVRRAYARGEYWDERVRMMQHWSDYLDQLRDGATILRPNFGNSGS